MRVRVLGLDDLIEVKTAIGRPQDRAALPYLQEIRRPRLTAASPLPRFFVRNDPLESRYVSTCIRDRRVLS